MKIIINGVQYNVNHEHYTVVDTKFAPRQKMTLLEKWSMLNSENYKNLDEIILNQ